MIEVAGVVAKWLQLVANMIVLGTCVFFVVASYDKATFHDPLLDRLERALPWLVAALAVFMLLELASKTAEITDVAANAWKPGAWLGVIKHTWLGKVWAARMGLVLLLLPIAIYVRKAPSARWRYLLCAVVAGAALTAASLSSHAVAEPSPLLPVSFYAVHMLMAGIWFGGLPAFLAVVYGALRRTDGAAGPSGLKAIHSFSAMALPVMIVILITGVLVGNLQVDGRYAALVSTDYGAYLLTKLGLLCAILVIAAYARFVWVPQLEVSNPPKAAAWRPLRRGVTVEFTLAVLLILAATLCASAIPAKHATIAYWPYPFRFSIAGTWDLGVPGTATDLLIGAGLFVAAVSLGLAWRRSRFHWRRSVLSAIVVLALSGIALSLYAISTRASVDSYRNTVVPFDAISIARGGSLFAANCTPCHGLQGKGDGPLAASLPKKPIDLLTEPHTAQHQVGDFYNWIGTGFPAAGMPPFAGRLTEDDRWDLVNYIHVISRGYQSRTLTPRVVPERPSKDLGAPDFTFIDQRGETRTLKDFRNKQTVLLVFFTWPEDKARLDAIRSEYEAIKNSDTEVIAIPWGGSTPDPQWVQQMPFPVVEGGSEIGRSYEEFRRTIANPDLFGGGEIPPHMELLVDRFGYLRGRWIPQQDSAGWSDDGLLSAQLEQLQHEPQILPPAADHVH